MRRATLATAFLAGAAIGIPLYLSPLLLSSQLPVRSVAAMVCLGYVALWAIYVIGPMTWAGWTFRPEGGTFEPLPRAVSWLGGVAVGCAVLVMAGPLPFK